MAIVAGDDAEAVSENMIRARALVNCFTEIGEAAARMTEAGRARIGAVP